MANSHAERMLERVAEQLQIAAEFLVRDPNVQAETLYCAVDLLFQAVSALKDELRDDERILFHSGE